MVKRELVEKEMELRGQIQLSNRMQDTLTEKGKAIKELEHNVTILRVLNDDLETQLREASTEDDEENHRSEQSDGEQCDFNPEVTQLEATVNDQSILGSIGALVTNIQEPNTGATTLTEPNSPLPLVKPLVVFTCF